MTTKIPNWALNLAMNTALLFVLLTTVAMFFYPGGTSFDPTVTRYLFFTNFFSELGLLAAYDGTPNPVGAAAFLVALSLAGLGLIVFFWHLPRLMGPAWWRRGLAWLSTFFGLVAGFSFIGVALTPADVLLEPHVTFVFYAFTSFFGAATGYAILFFTHPQLSNRLAAVFIFFTVALGLYLYLLFFGPGMATPAGITIQATGQKIIGYISVSVTFIVSWQLKQDNPAAQPQPTPAGRPAG